jgi:hypothetical protein
VADIKVADVLVAPLSAPFSFPLFLYVVICSCVCLFVYDLFSIYSVCVCVCVCVCVMVAGVGEMNMSGGDKYLGQFKQANSLSQMHMHTHTHACTNARMHEKCVYVHMYIVSTYAIM